VTITAVSAIIGQFLLLIVFRKSYINIRNEFNYDNVKSKGESADLEPQHLLSTSAPFQYLSTFSAPQHLFSTSAPSSVIWYLEPALTPLIKPSLKSQWQT
jgi:hypothetical protein